MDKLLTIIIPSYNMERYLEKCVTSLGIEQLLQEASEVYGNYATALDVIIVNDGSKDRTSEIAHAFAKKYPDYVKVIDKPNGHYGSCINVGVAIARGKYVKILEADDTYNTENFCQFIKYIDKMNRMDPTIDVFLSSMCIVNHEGEIFGKSVHNLQEEMIHPIRKLVETKGCIFNAGLTYRVSLLKEIGYSQTEGICYSDTDWFLIPIAYARTLACFNGIIYQYLKGRDDQSTNDVQYARNTEHVKTITFNLLKKWPELQRVADPDVAKYIYRMIGDCLISVYRVAILGPARRHVKVNLATLDAELKVLNPQMWQYFGEVRYANKLPYRYVAAWRKGEWKQWFMGWVCCTYSKLAMKVKL